MGGQAKDEQAALRTTEAVAVLAEMERHALLPNPVVYYAAKLRTALGVVGPLTCTCGACTRDSGLCRCGPPWVFSKDDQCPKCNRPLPDEAY